MSLLLSVILATRRRSMHHCLALDALRFLKGPHAAAWRGLLLHHHEQYLKGSKAPDDVFKDYKNHVLHVREGEWGGAIEAAQEWRKRTVRAMKEKDWSHVAWCAGVMSHYVVDPCQPFHTHQTEEENVIHRAAEYSFYKSYPLLKGLLERDLGGHPDIVLSGGDDWVADLVRQGARAANQFYETVIDHYNFAAALKRPEDGLDYELRVAIAQMVGRAIIGWARALDRMCAEASVKPPKLNGAMQALFLTVEAPIQGMLGLAADARERRYVAAQFEEYRKTGKVRSTLSEDDATVRALHAAEVLKAPLSSLDARWPREIGTAYKPGKPKKTRAERPKQPAPEPVKPKTAAPPPPAAAPAAATIKAEQPPQAAQAPRTSNASPPAAAKRAPPAPASQVSSPAKAAPAQAAPARGSPSPTAQQPAQAAPPRPAPSAFFNPAAPAAPAPAPPAQPTAQQRVAASESKAAPKQPPSQAPTQPRKEPVKTEATAKAAKGAGKAEAASSRGTAQLFDAAGASKGDPNSEPDPDLPPLLLTKKVVDKRKRKKGGDEELFTLKGASQIVEAPSIGPKMARRFQAMGVRTVSDLLALSPATAAVLLDMRDVSAPDIADWQAQAMLACTVPDLIHREAQAVVACGVQTVEELAQSDAKALAASMREWAKDPDGARAWGHGPPPSLEDAQSLVERALAVSRRPKSAA